MSLQEELPIWNAAIAAYEREDVQSALDLFERLQQSTKVLFNIGLIYATVGHHTVAVEKFEVAGSRDKYLGIAHFQCGVSYFLLSKFYLALQAFERALVTLRGNGFIDYQQIGLKFKLYKAEITFNIGLCRINLGDSRRGLGDLSAAYNYRSIPAHEVILQALRDRAQGYTMFSIPVGVLFEPFGAQIKNLPRNEANLLLASEQLISVTKLDLEQPWLLGASHPNAATNVHIQPPRRAKTPQPSANPARAPSPPVATLDFMTSSSAPNTTRAIDLARNRSAMPAAPRLQRARSKSVSEGTPKISRSRSAVAALAAAGAPVQGDIPAVPIVPLNISNPRTPRGWPPAPAVQTQALERKVAKRDTIDITIQDLMSTYYLPSPASPQAPPLPRSESPRQVEQPIDEETSLPYLRPAASSDSLRSMMNRPAPPNRPLPQAPHPPLPGPANSLPRHQLLRKATGSPTKGLLSEDEGYHTGSSISSYDSSSSDSSRPSIKKLRRVRTIAPLTDDEGYTTDRVVASGKVKFKLHWNEEIRAIMLPNDAPLQAFFSKVAAKLDVPINELSITFGLDKNMKQPLRDEGDYRTAMEYARTKLGGRIHVWCV
jgi:hypothetical protein